MNPPVSSITRKAFLLHYGIGEIEKYQIGSDLGLVKAFLTSVEGGCFTDEEIVDISSNQLDKADLIAAIDSVDYSFIYFAGHSHFEQRLIYIPLKNEQFIKESELVRSGKKQWIFLDTCRSNDIPPKSTEFLIANNFSRFSIPFEEAKMNWLNHIAELNPFYLICYTTELGGTAYSNEGGGFGTQLFFSIMHEQLLKLGNTNLTSIAEDCKSNGYNIDQRMNYINGNASLNCVPFVFRTYMPSPLLDQ